MHEFFMQKKRHGGIPESSFNQKLLEDDQSSIQSISQNMEKEREALEESMEKTYQFLFDLTSDMHESNIYFVPNLDGCYHYRHGREFSWNPVFGEGEPKTLLKQKKKAMDMGIPDPSFLEKNLIYQINYDARSDAFKANNKLFALKHFPGGDERIEWTENLQVFFDKNLEQMKETYLLPFEYAISTNSPKAIMVNHAAYPNMEKDLRDKHSNMLSALPADIPLPSSMSPLVIRGLLRSELGYTGLVVSDWLSMGSIIDFAREAKKSKSLRKELSSLSLNSLIIIFSVYAGLNWPTGLNERGLHLNKRTLSEIENLYRNDSEFQKLFDELILESVLLKFKAIPRILRPSLPFAPEKINFSDLYLDDSNLSHSKAYELSELKKFTFGSASTPRLTFAQKMQVLLVDDFSMLNSSSETSFLPHSEQISKLVDFYSQWSDGWNAGGLIHLKFRKDFVEHLSENKFKDITDFENEADWLVYLKSNDDFQQEYRKIDWESPGMQSLFREALSSY